MHEIHKLQLNGGEKCVAITNGATNGDTNDYVKKLKEANIHCPIKSPCLPPNRQATIANEEKSTETVKKKSFFLSDRYAELLQKYQNQCAVNGIEESAQNKQQQKQKKTHEFEEEPNKSDSQNYTLIDVYDTEDEREERNLNSVNINQYLRSRKPEENFDLVLLENDSDKNCVDFNKSERTFHIINSTAINSPRSKAYQKQQQDKQLLNDSLSAYRLLNGNSTKSSNLNGSLSKKTRKRKADELFDFSSSIQLSLVAGVR